MPVERLIYTGMGSSGGSLAAVDRARRLGARMAELGWVLRTGGCPGVDRAFTAGASQQGGASEIYLPWKGYGGHVGLVCGPDEYQRAMQIAQKAVDNWSTLTEGQRLLKACIVLELLGSNLRMPSRVLVCWSPDGCESAAATTRRTGDAALAIHVAEQSRIPVVNIARTDALLSLKRIVEVEKAAA